MTLAILLAPGPSMSRELADSVRGRAMVGVITSAWPLAPWADFLAATDASWWRKTPEAVGFAGRKFSPGSVSGVEKVRLPCDRSSLVVGMEVAKLLGATKIALLGVDHHGTHFFGPYTNGCRNTSLKRRGDHAAQYAHWAKRNAGIEIVNCTPGSALTVFQLAQIEDVLRAADLGAVNLVGDGDPEGAARPGKGSMAIG